MAIEYENYTSTAGNFSVYGTSRQFGQTFTVGVGEDHTLTSVFLYLFPFAGGNSGTLTLTLWDTSGSLPTGGALDSASINASTVSSAAWYEFVFSGGIDLLAGTEYAVTLSNPSGDFATNIKWYGNNSGNYSGGVALFNTGGGWSVTAARDLSFQEWGDAVVAAPEAPVEPFPEDGQTKVANGEAIPLIWLDDGFGESNQAESFDIYLDSGLGASDPDHLVAEDVTDTVGNGVYYWFIPENIHELMGDISRTYLGAGTQYFWKVVAKIGDEETESDVWDFRTSLIRGLGAPFSPTPVDEGAP
jgi:hypothetical protein